MVVVNCSSRGCGALRRGRATLAISGRSSICGLHGWTHRHTAKLQFTNCPADR
jgi:hypothetical protein